MRKICRRRLVQQPQLQADLQPPKFNVCLYEALVVKVVVRQRRMTVSFVGYVFVPRAGLAMSSMSRASDRINLYPAAPIRLATMLRAWTITERGMGLIFTSAPSPNGSTVTHPTRQQAPPLGSEACWNC